MTTIPAPATPAPPQSTALAEVTTAIERLMADLDSHEQSAIAIRATLKELRKRLAATGKRAGVRARSGRRRLKGERPLPLDEAEPLVAQG